MSKPIILYRYHNNFELVAERLKLVKMLEPDTDIYGIYGGAKDGYKESTQVLKPYLADNYFVPVEDGRWKWLHADITYKMWFEAVGKSISFDMAYVLEWDLLILEKLAHVFPHANTSNVICTGLIPLEEVKNYWYWTNDLNFPKVNSFFDTVRKHYQKPFVEYASLGPGLCMPRDFLVGLTEMKLFEADVTDEVKIPVWSQLMGLKPVANNFYKKWFAYKSLQYFNTNTGNVETREVAKALHTKNGQRVFHPFRGNVLAETLFQIYSEGIEKNGDYKITPPFNIKAVQNLLNYKVQCKLFAARFNVETKK